MPTPKQPLAPLVSRRQILSGAGAAASALILSPSRVHAGSDETIKIGLIGCGGRGSGAVAQALETAGPVKLWAMADAFGDRIDTSLAGLSNTKIEKSRIDVAPERRFVGLDAYRQLIDHGGVDLVILTTSPGYRPQHFEYAVKAGKHVFMEKPIATDAPGIRRLLSANEIAKQKNLKVGVGLQRHHDPTYIELVKRLQDGAIGDLAFYRCSWDTAAPGKKPFPRDGLTELQYQIRNWYWFSWLSGDHIVEQHIHNIDVCNWVQGGYPVSAQGQGGRQVRIGKEYGNIYDHHYIEFTYADGRKMYSQCRQIPGCMNSVAESAYGSQGWCELSTGRICPTGGEEIRLRTNTRPSRRDPSAKFINPFQVEHDDLFAAIRSDKPYNEVERGAYSTLTAILGRMASYSGKVVSWDSALNSQLRLTTDAENWDAAAPVTPGDDGYYAVAMPGITVAV